jgi:hypothetical protein
MYFKFKWCDIDGSFITGGEFVEYQLHYDKYVQEIISLLDERVQQ